VGHATRHLVDCDDPVLAQEKVSMLDATGGCPGAESGGSLRSVGSDHWVGEVGDRIGRFLYRLPDAGLGCLIGLEVGMDVEVVGREVEPGCWSQADRPCVPQSEGGGFDHEHLGLCVVDRDDQRCLVVAGG